MYINKCMYIYIYIDMTYTYIYIYICMYVCMYVCIYMHIFVMPDARTAYCQLESNKNAREMENKCFCEMLEGMPNGRPNGSANGMSIASQKHKWKGNCFCKLN